MHVLRIAPLVRALGVLVAQASAHVAAPPANVNVSNLPGPQTNATITIDPRNPDVLLAGSNSVFEGTQRVYSSLDGGATWHSAITIPPAAELASACPSDPGLAIDLTGRQYYSYDVATPCNAQGSSHIYVLTRPNATAAWSDPILVAPLGRGVVGPVPRRPAGPPPLRRQAGDRGRRVAVQPSPEPGLHRVDPGRP